MPTSDEILALFDNCTTTWITTNGVSGRLVTGKGSYANRSIFLPAAAGYDDSDLIYPAGSDGVNWSSTPYSGNSIDAWGICFGSGYFSRGINLRYFGHSVDALPAQADIDRIITRHGVWLRPFSRYIYTMPPLVSDTATVMRITEAIRDLASCPAGPVPEGDFHE